MDIEKAISLENLNQYKKNTSEKIKSYVDTKTSVIQDGTKAVGGVSAEDYNNFKSAYEDKHTHSNKSVLDEISEKTLNGGTELSGSTSYTVTDSVEYPLVGLKAFGKSEQKQYSGKNLAEVFDQTVTKNGLTFTRNEKGGLVITGTASTNTSFRIDQLDGNMGNFKTYSAGTYTLSLKDKDGNIITSTEKIANIALMQINTWIMPIQSSFCQTNTFPSDYPDCFIVINIKSGAVFDNYEVYPQLELGSTATDYEPYVGGIPSPNPDYPQEITSVVEPTVTVCGKNLINARYQTTTKAGITCTNNNNGTYTLNGTATGEAVFTIVSRLDISGAYRIIGCPPNGSNGTYNISVNVDGAWSVNNYDIGNGLIINPSSYIIIAIAVRNGVTCNNLVFKPMLTTDLTATYNDFEQYKENTLSLPDTLNAIPVLSGGNVTIDGQEYIADYKDFAEGRYHKLVDPNKLDPTVSIVDNLDLLLASEEITDISESEMQAYRQLHTYNGVTNIINDKGAGISVEYCTNKALSACVMPVTKDLQKQIDDLKAAVLSLGGNV